MYNKAYVYRMALVASTGGFLFGYDLIIIAGALSYIEKEFALTATLRGFAVSSAILGAIVGPLVGLWFAEVIGRKKTLMLAAIVFMLSTVGCAVADSIWQFCGWRFAGGMGIGLAMISSPIYIAELAPPQSRGTLVNVNQLSNVLGINLAVLVSYLFSFYGWGWRWMLASQALPVLVLISGLLLVPESPRWLAARNRLNEALDVLSRINGPEKGAAELAEIKTDLMQEIGSSRELLLPGTRKALLIGIVIMIFSQINGVNMLLLYGPTILAEAGISIGSSAILSSMPVYILIFICTLLAFPLITRYSRRGLLITSAVFMSLGHILMALWLQLHWPPLGILIPMLIGTGAFTLGLAPLSWIIVSEIFPTRVRSKALAVVCFFLFGSSFLTAQLFPVLTDWFTQHHQSPAGVYWLFAGVCLACAVFSWRAVPETKGLSLEEISEFWRNRDTPQLMT